MTACNAADHGPDSAREDTAAVAQIDAGLRERFSEVRALHDEVMPRRSELVDLERRLGEPAVGRDTTGLAFAKTRLTRADDAMMTWMYNDEPLEGLVQRLGPTRAAQHLDLRGREMQGVADSMQAAIAYAQSLLR